MSCCTSNDGVAGVRLAEVGDRVGDGGEIDDDAVVRRRGVVGAMTMLGS